MAACFCPRVDQGWQLPQSGVAGNFTETTSLIWPSNYSDPNVSILLGTGAGRAPKVNYNRGNAPSSLVRRLQQDGRPHLLVNQLERRHRERLIANRNR